MAQGQGHQPEIPCTEDDDFVLIPKSHGLSQDELPEIFRLPSCKGFDLYEVSVDELQHLYSSGALTSVEYVKFCLDSIQRVRIMPLVIGCFQALIVHKTNPYLESVIETNPDALEHAKKLDDERKIGNVRSRLHGIPVLVKDVSGLSVASTTQCSFVSSISRF